MHRYAGILVGRQRELALLEQALDELDEGSAAIVQIVGEPGIGKTRLVGEVLDRAEQRGTLTLIGRGAEFERDFPFGMLADALDDYLGSLDSQRFEQLDRERLRELATVFPSLTSLVGERPSALREERYRLHRAVRSLLEQLAQDRPLALALDDLHWADAASIELVLHLLRRPPEASVLLLLSYRPHQLPPRIAAVLEAALRDGVGERFELAPLSEEEASELLGAAVDRETRKKIYRESGGNPFYLEQLARAPRLGEQDATTEPATPDEAGVPPAVAAAIAKEIATLSERARALLQAAAVVGEAFEPDLVAETVGVGEQDSLAALDELLDLDLIRPAAAPRRFRFRHPIVRHAVYESAKGGWRLAAHARAAAALAARGASPVARAHHVERSARVGDEAAIALLTEGAHTTTSHAPATAARWFQAALRLLPEGDDTAQRRLELLVPMAIALGSTGRLEESRDALRQVLELLPSDPSPLRLRAVAFEALVEHLLGNHSAAQELVLEAVLKLPERRSTEAAQLKGQLAWGHFFSADWDGMRYWARQALEARPPDGSPDAAAVGARALAEYCVGDTARAERSVAEAAALIDALPDEEVAAQLEAVLLLGFAEHCTERMEEAARHLARGLAVSRATGQGHLIIPLLTVQGNTLLWQGRLAEAAELAEAATESSLLSANNLFLTWALALRCLVEIELGDLSAAARFGEQAVALGTKSASPWASVGAAVASWYLAETLLELGEPGRCREQLLNSGGAPELPAFPLYTSLCYEILTRADLALGRLEDATRWAEAAEGLDLKGQTVEAHRARAAVLLADGDPARAADVALQSVEAAEQAGRRIEAARCRILAGRALADAGKRERAIAELEQARTELSACEARRYRDQAAHELRRLGLRVSRRGRRGRPGTGVAALSGRELEVAQLVTDGRRNRQIAAELFLSEKTIESHLSHIFAKLAVSSRAEVAAAMERAQEEAAARVSS